MEKGGIQVKVMSAELENGYIFKNFFTFSCIKSRIIIAFSADSILSQNAAAENEEMYEDSFLYGDEIAMSWEPSIREEDRKILIAFDAQKLQGAFADIKKKDQARLVLTQMRNSAESPFDPLSAEYFILVSKGAGGDGREGIVKCAGTRVFEEEKLIIHKPPRYSSLLVIPNRVFKQMIDTFAKCKKKRICITYYDNGDLEPPGISITTKGIGLGSKGKGPYEKFGNIPDIDPAFALSETSNENIPEDSPLNEYSFDFVRLINLLRLSALHNEGNVRIYYAPKYPLRLAARFGSFGECELYIYDKNKFQMNDTSKGDRSPSFYLENS